MENLPQVESMVESDRDLPTINAVLELAKLERSDLRPCVQVVKFSENLSNDLKLLELNKTVLEDLQVGKKVVIRGLKDDHAVLCSDDKTFEIKEAETSNSLLIVPRLQFPEKSDDDQSLHTCEVTSIVRSYYELRPCKPRLKRLTDLLSENTYSGRESEGDEDHTGHKYTLQELINTVQASEREITGEIAKIKACQINGEWRLLDFDFRTQVLNHIITLCEENDWLKTGVDMEVCLRELGQLYPKEVISHVISMYSQSSISDDAADAEATVRLDDDKICQFFAELLLRHADKFNLGEFMSVWKESVPQTMKTHISQLKGLALIDTNCHPSVVWHYPVDSLPENVEQRFMALFKAKEKWTLDEISPYIQDVTTDKLDIGALLLKYCRSSMVNGVKVYNSRRPVS